jgi:hypothetical protein
MTVLNLTWFRAHPPPSKGEGIIFCYYKRFSYPLCQVRVKLSLEGGGGGAFSWFVGGVPAMKWLHNNTGRGHSLASAITSPGKKVAEDISKARMIPKGTEALSPAL